METMCIWDCELKDRHCEFCAYEPCAERRREDRALVAEEYIKAMEDVTGLDLKDGHRQSEKVWARNMVAYKMFIDGFGSREIEASIGKSRCLVMYAVGRVQNMLNLPNMYPREMAVWRKFQKKLQELK